MFRSTVLNRPMRPCASCARLRRLGLEAWYVGGWVRDALMGYPSHDVRYVL